MIKPFHIRTASTVLMLALLAGCAAQSDLQRARDDTVTAVRIAAKAEATAAAAADRAGKAASQAAQARQTANATAQRAESLVRSATPASTPVSSPARPVSRPMLPAEPVTPPGPVTPPAEPVTPPADPVVAPAEPVVTPGEPAVTGDAVAGKNKARRCMACHTFNDGGGHKMGPSLFGISGKAAGSAAGYNFSSGLKNAGFTWDAGKLAAWVCDSKAAIKELTGNADARTTMANQRICGSDANNVAAYLETLK